MKLHKVVVSNGLQGFADVYSKDLAITNKRLNRLEKGAVVGLIFGLYCYRKIKKQQEQIRQLNKEVKELREEQDNATLSKEIDDILD